MDAQVQVQKARKVVPAPTLTAKNGAMAGTTFRLGEDESTIGRRGDNAHVVPDPRVSRVHASLRKEAGSYIITDLGSSTGTIVNGETLAGPRVLHHGDLIKLGPIEFAFEDPSAMGQGEQPTMVIDLPSPAQGPRLSPRQEQVLELMAQGLTNKEIGEQLGVTERTVKAYAQELYDKLDARNRAGAVAEAAKLGML